MKVKAVLLAALFVLGLGASFAFAKSPNHGQTTGTTTTTGKSPKTKCGQVELKGNATAGSVTLTVTRANNRAQSLVGTAVTLVIPPNARIRAKACSATGGVLTLRDVHVSVSPAKEH